jgi:hypothetical protein
MLLALSDTGVVPALELEAFTLRLARQITANAPLSIAVMRSSCGSWLGRTR